MALFKNAGGGASRAAGIISDLNQETQKKTPKQEDPPKQEQPVETDPPKVETPAPAPTEEPKPEDKSPKDKANPGEPKPEDPAQDPPQITEEAVFKYLSGTLKRPIESIDDLTVKEERELDPELKQLLEWKEKTGLSLSKWSDYNRDFSKMNDLDVAKEMLAQENPTFTEEEIEYSLRSYVFNEDNDDEEERIAKSIALKQYAQKGRTKLEEQRLSLVASESNRLSPEMQQDLEAYTKIKESQAQVQQDQALYVENLGKAATSFEAINLKLSDDITVKYDTSEAERKSLVELSQTMPHWYNQDGTVNHNSILQDTLKIRDFDQIVRKAYEQGVNVGKEGQIKADRNITLDVQTPPGNDVAKPKKGNVDEVADKIAGKSGKGKHRYGRVKK